MKKIIMIAAIAMASVTANAQVWVGGALGFNVENNKTTDVSTTTFSVIPEIGYNFDENWAAAVDFGFTSESTDVNGSKAKTSFSVSPFVRYTYAKAGNVSFYLDGGFGITSYNNDGGSVFNVGVRPGIAVAASEKISFAASLGWIGYTNYDKKAGNKDKFGLNVSGEALKFGVYYNF